MPEASPQRPDAVRPPAFRLRRWRRTPSLRDWVAETEVSVRHLVYPVFVAPGEGRPEPIGSMPGVARHPVSRLPSLAAELRDEGIRSVLLFGLARRKDPSGSEAWSATGAVARAARAFKATAPEIVVVTDVCLCAYTSHGHCGVLDRQEVDNDATLVALGRVAKAHAAAGADVVAPSAMMDGQVASIRGTLDEAGFERTGILSYATKHASAFYGPFRDAEQSTPSFGDRRTYQMDWRNAREALREMELDQAEGADALMVKPALTSLDLLARARPLVRIPLAAYQVSGEFASIKAAAAAGVLEERAAVEETLGAVRRAGADLIVTYFARDVARWRRSDR